MCLYVIMYNFPIIHQRNRIQGVWYFFHGNCVRKDTFCEVCMRGFPKRSIKQNHQVTVSPCDVFLKHRALLPKINNTKRKKNVIMSTNMHILKFGNTMHEILKLGNPMHDDLVIKQMGRSEE